MVKYLKKVVIKPIIQILILYIYICMKFMGSFALFFYFILLLELDKGMYGFRTFANSFILHEYQIFRYKTQTQKFLKWKIKL